MYKTGVYSEKYGELLAQYLDKKTLTNLIKTKEMSMEFVDQNLYPEEIVQIHLQAVESNLGELNEDHKHALSFLIEAFKAYREAQDEYKKIKEEQSELKSEIQVAANMQKTLLRTEVPGIPGVEIGAISVPYHQMNGDYFHFITGEDGTMGVAIADIIGKGVPAALSMSMIKYAMDSFYSELMSPSTILRNLNRVVERNVAAHMFITMFYGQFFPRTGVFKFSSAGHEPGFIYREKTGQFSDLNGKGMVLGVLKNSKYNQYAATLKKGDMIVLLTDGVTECRKDDQFITREEVAEVVLKYNHYPAQKQVEKVYHDIKKYKDYELKDDFTLIIIKKDV